MSVVSTSLARSSTHPNRRRRWRRWFIAALIVQCVISLLVVRTYRHEARVKQLVAEIKQAGGQAIFPYPAWERLWQRVRGERLHTYDGTHVELPPDIDPEWLEERDYLADLAIEELFVEAAPDLSPALPTLVARHPLRKLWVWKNRCTGADEIAAVLSDNRTLTELALQDSDLTDAGLQCLPLEQIEELGLRGTQVTADGLRELRRARRLHLIMLDGQQVSPEVVSILEETTETYSLSLGGPEVTDDTIEMLIAELEQRPAARMRELVLSDSSVTDSGAAAWVRARPTIKFHRLK